MEFFVVSCSVVDPLNDQDQSPFDEFASTRNACCHEIPRLGDEFCLVEKKLRNLKIADAVPT